ncbi:MAG: hypothetical protein LBJ45_01700 [Holosporaceae bacterium]|jgi:hypothetical protein|nr:hypothetical protein [Holosporaceae bacterium]
MYPVGHPVSKKAFLNCSYHCLAGTFEVYGQDVVGVGANLSESIIGVDFLGAAPFKWIGGSIIFQLRNLDCLGTITLGRISKKYECVEPCIYPDYRTFHAACILSRKALLDFEKIFSLEEIIAIGRKYNLKNTHVFEEMLSKMGSIPKWTEEMGEHILDPEKETNYWNDKWMQNPQLVIDLYNESIGVDTSNDNRYLKFHAQNKR